MHRGKRAFDEVEKTVEQLGIILIAIEETSIGDNHGSGSKNVKHRDEKPEWT